MKEELEHVLRPSQSKLQHGFTPGMCPLACAVLLQEVLSEAKANKLEYYEALLDAKSAFDVVYQNNLSCTRYSDGVRGSLWLMTRELNKDATSRVNGVGKHLILSQSHKEYAKAESCQQIFINGSLIHYSNSWRVLVQVL